MRRYLVWEPEEGETVEEAVIVESFSAAMAAEEATENWCYDYEAFPITVCVQNEESDEVFTFEVDVDFDPVYSATLKG